MSEKQKQEVEHKELRPLMQREIALMRELLSSMEAEQQALLKGDAEQLKEVITAREPLIETMSEVRNQRIEALFSLALEHELTLDAQGQLTEEICHEILTLYANGECCEILGLRDQMLALIEAMKEQSSTNNYLLKSKIDTTRQLIQRLHPDDPNKTYNKTGSVQKKVATATVAVVNKEG